MGLSGRLRAGSVDGLMGVYIELTALQVIKLERELLRREGKDSPSTSQDEKRKLNKEASD